MDSNRFIVLLLPEKHSSFIAVQAEEDAVFSESANMFARALLCTKRVLSVCVCVFLAFINREEETTGARKVQRERYDGGDINDLSMDNLSLVFLLWCKKSLSNFLKEKRSVDCPAPENDHNYEAKESNRWSNTENIIERTKRTEEQKKEKKKENHTRTLFLVFDASSFTPNRQTREFFTTKRLFDFVL